jgi:hypothetical protein
MSGAGTRKNLALAALSARDAERIDQLSVRYMDCEAIQQHIDSAASD